MTSLYTKCDVILPQVMWPQQKKSLFSNLIVTICPFGIVMYDWSFVQKLDAKPLREKEFSRVPTAQGKQGNWGKKSTGNLEILPKHMIFGVLKSYISLFERWSNSNIALFAQIVFFRTINLCQVRFAYETSQITEICTGEICSQTGKNRENRQFGNQFWVGTLFHNLLPNMTILKSLPRLVD